MQPAGKIESTTLRMPTYVWWFGLAAIAARFAIILFWVDWTQPIFEYERIARHLIEGRGFSWNYFGWGPLQPTSMYPPLYIYWCAFWMWLSPESNSMLIYFSQAVVGASGVIPMFLVVRKLFGDRAAWWGVLAYALFPELAFLSARPVAEAILVVEALWLFWFYLKLRDRLRDGRPWLRTAIAFGLVGGISILTKGSLIAPLAAAGVALVIAGRRNFPRLLRIGAVSFGVFLLVLTPWMIRNYVVQDKFIPIREAYGLVLWLGNNKYAYGNNRSPSGGLNYETYPQEYMDYILENLPEDEQDMEHFYKEEALRHMREDPGHVVEVWWRKLVCFFWFDPFAPFAQHPVYRAGYIGVLLFGIPGIILAIRRRLFDSVFPLTVLGLLFMYIPTVMLPRYRILYVLILLMFSAFWISTQVSEQNGLLNRFLRRTSRDNAAPRINA